MSANATPTRQHPDERLRAASDWLFRLHEERVGEPEVAEWIQWCESDAGNLAAFEEMEAAWKGFGDLPEPVKARLAALASRPRSRRSPASWPRIPLLAAAVAAMFVIAGSFYLWEARSDRPELLIGSAVQSGPARNQDATLPDGSLVALGAKSALNIDFGSSERRLRMRDGQAYFKVRPDRERPFVVEAGPIEVRAVGTAFDVRKNEGRVVVSVTEGVVEVASSAGTATDQRQNNVRVVAGYQLVWDAGGKDVRLAAADSASATGWRTGRLEYLGEPLWAVIANVNRYAAHPIEIAESSIGDLQFTGTVFTASIEDWLQTLPQAFPVVCERRGDGSVLVKRR